MLPSSQTKVAAVLDWLCIEIPSYPDPFDLILPGGVTLEAINLMEIIQPALAPLVPFFRIVDVVAALFKCIQAIPDAFGPPPDPTIMAACLPPLAEHIAALLAMQPALSLPILVRRLLDLAIQTLREVRSQLLHLQAQMRHILLAVDRAKDLEDANLMAIIGCAQANVAIEAANVGKQLASLGRLLGLVGIFMGLIGGPEIPDLSTVAGQPLDDVAEPINDLIEALKIAQRAIPMP